MLDDPHEHDELRWQDQSRRDDEHDRGVVGLVTRRAHGEELRNRCERPENEEAAPLVRVLEPPEERQRRRRGCDRDDDEVDPGAPGQRLVPSRAGLGDERDIGGRRAHALEPSVIAGVSPSPCALRGPQTEAHG